MAKTRKHTEVVIGTFYQRTEDPRDVVYAVGGSTIRVYGYDVHGNAFKAKPEEVMQWTMLAVNDFPNSPDPRLVYAFDLHWDIKRVSQLRIVDSDAKAGIEALLVQEYGVQKPFSNMKKLANAVRQYNDVKNEYVGSPVLDDVGGPSP